MKKQMKKNHPLMKTVNSSLTDLPSPSSISYMWNTGFMLGMCLVMQITTGLLISMHYSSSIQEAFSSVIHLSRDVSNGHTTRFMHMNGASLFFILLYAHIARGVAFSSPSNKKEVWSTGLMLLLMVMATAFLGYVLPWGQMSFWGATVITNIFSAIPYMGKSIVEWMWGNFSVSQPTLTRFFSLHFITPMAIASMVMIHLMLLHEKGSSNPMCSQTNMDKVPFHPFFSTKDAMPMITVMMLMTMMVSKNPNMLGDPENFNPANPMATPVHIQPEWYFLFAYAILRSIPSKLGGVIALIASILMMSMPMKSKKKIKSSKFSPTMKSTMWALFATFMMLTWIGANPVEPPYESTGQVMSTAYFTLITMMTVCFRQ